MIARNRERLKASRQRRSSMSLTLHHHLSPRDPTSSRGVLAVTSARMPCATTSPSSFASRIFRLPSLLFMQPLHLPGRRALPVSNLLRHHAYLNMAKISCTNIGVVTSKCRWCSVIQAMHHRYSSLHQIEYSSLYQYSNISCTNLRHKYK